MAFRYEIWELGVGEDKYFPEGYSYLADVTPADGNFSLKIEKHPNEFFYRVLSDGSLVFRGDDYNLISDVIDSCQVYAVFMYDGCAGDRGGFIRNNFWNVADYIGIIKRSNVVKDYDRCTISVELETIDVYSKLLLELDSRIDLIGGSRVTTDFSMYPYFIEEENVIIDPTPIAPPIPTANENYFYECDDLDPDFRCMILRNASITLNNDNEYFGNMRFFRMYRVEATNDPIDGWTSLGAFGSGYKFVKYPIDPDPRPIYNFAPQTPTSAYGVWTLNEVNVDNTTSFTTGFDLRDRLNLAINFIGTYGGGVQGQFITSSVNPITEEENRLKWLVVVQQSDVKGRSDKATFYDITTRDLLDYYKYLNAGWYISVNDSGQMTLRIEHRKFFDNGGTYLSGGSFIYPEYVDTDKNRKVISLLVDKAERLTSFELGTIGTIEFRERDIFYNDDCTSENANTIALSPLTPDIVFIRDNPDETPDDGVVILATKKVGSTYSIMGEVVGGSIVINGHLTPTKVLENYWRNGAPTDTATLRSPEDSGGQIISDFDIDSVKRLKQRDDFILNNIMFKAIDPRRLIQTDFGVAEFKSLTYSPRTKKWTATLLYE